MSQPGGARSRPTDLRAGSGRWPVTRRAGTPGTDGHAAFAGRAAAAEFKPNERAQAPSQSSPVARITAMVSSTVGESAG